MAAPTRIAVADLGTNSTRLLVAELDADGKLRELERRTNVTRLGEGVDASGRLGDAPMERVHTTLGEYRALAERHGAVRAVAVATSAVRDADNGAEFAAAVRERDGFDLRIIDGDEEARLTFLGATAGRGGARRDGDAPTTLVIDIGGGSTEYVAGPAGEPPTFHVSTRLGSVRQTERHLASDPPEHAEMEALARAAREIVADSVPPDVRESVDECIAVAGTATSLAAIDQQLDPYDPARVHGYRLVLGECERMLARLAAVPVEQRREVPGLHPDRAPTILAGVVILIESMRLFDLSIAEVSEADILHGAALEALAHSD